MQQVRKNRPTNIALSLRIQMWRRGLGAFLKNGDCYCGAEDVAVISGDHCQRHEQGKESKHARTEQMPHGYGDHLLVEEASELLHLASALFAVDEYLAGRLDVRGIQILFLGERFVLADGVFLFGDGVERILHPPG